MGSKILGYVYDSRYYKYENKICAAGVFEISVWERFLGGFDKFLVFASIYEAKKEVVENLNKMNHPKVEYIDVKCIDSLSNIFNSNKIFTKYFHRIDALVKRVSGQYTNNAFHVAKK